jgi:hypothetical protein
VDALLTQKRRPLLDPAALAGRAASGSTVQTRAPGSSGAISSWGGRVSASHDLVVQLPIRIDAQVDAIATLRQAPTPVREFMVLKQAPEASCCARLVGFGKSVYEHSNTLPLDDVVQITDPTIADHGQPRRKGLSELRRAGGPL